MATPVGHTPQPPKRGRPDVSTSASLLAQLQCNDLECDERLDGPFEPPQPTPAQVLLAQVARHPCERASPLGLQVHRAPDDEPMVADDNDVKPEGAKAVTSSSSMALDATDALVRKDIARVLCSKPEGTVQLYNAALRVHRHCEQRAREFRKCDPDDSPSIWLRGRWNGKYRKMANDCIESLSVWVAAEPRT